MQNNYSKAENYEVVPAGFFVRLTAFMIDSIIIGIMLFIVRIPIWIASIFVTDAIWHRDILFTFSSVDIFMYVLTVLYFIILTYCAGATLGKKIMNIQVVSSVGEELTKTQVVYRETIGRYLSVVISFLGYLLILVDKEKRALHDVLADTKVVYAKRLKVDTYYRKSVDKEIDAVPTFVEPTMSGESEIKESTEEINELEKEEVISEDRRF